ncbi:MAG: Hsp70 family protein [Candidatus Obscuribacterales bacterium]|nr:Hsp70 family protein [Candidatus Obscuribacterales bacterium]
MADYVQFGIDLGTTNSCIAKFEDDAIKVFRNGDQMNVTPSAVRIEKTGRIIVGRRASATRQSSPENVAIEFKRWIGQKDKFTFQSNGASMLAEELSAEVLKSLLNDVRLQTESQPDSAVITVPAAFGQLQCEATARAAKLAGLVYSPLLQEPIAAAIAYGIKPGAEGQRWLVFDLGGGTFDVAIISSRDGQLHVLDHRGNNHLGGKDIDHDIVNTLMLPELRKHFKLPLENEHPDRYKSLVQRLLSKAEEGKIDLSTQASAILSIFDVGQDLDGTPIEAELELSNSMLENISAPVLDKCASLAKEVIAGARLEVKNLDRILLVGGPTQMPILRKRLQEIFPVPLEFSLDPMTVVAQGAAIFASGMEKRASEPTVPVAETTQAATAQKPNLVKLVLAYEAVSSDIKPSVAGRIEYPEEISIRIDSKSGHWTSGWINTVDHLFDESVTLVQGKTSHFFVYARDKDGKNLELDQTSFSIRHGLSVSAPPLPHSISIEVIKADGKAELDPLLRRNSPLPNEASKVYRSHKTLRPSENEEIALKLWEGEDFDNPLKNELVGTLLIKSSKLRRVLPEGTEIELSIRFDTSRLIRVDAFVPTLNQHFSEEVYVPERDEEIYSDQAKKLDKKVEQYYERLTELEVAYGSESAEQLRSKIEEFDIKLQNSGTASRNDPDKAKQLVHNARQLGAEIETQRVAAANAHVVEDAKYNMDSQKDIVENYGSEGEKKELQLLIRDLERSATRNDQRSIQKIDQAFTNLVWRILFRQQWYWAQAFEYLRDGNHSFTNPAVAKNWLGQGNKALSAGDQEKLRIAVKELWTLLPQTEEREREKSMQAGIRRL